jgi:hypothetical protein
MIDVRQARDFSIDTTHGSSTPISEKSAPPSSFDSTLHKANTTHEYKKKRRKQKRKKTRHKLNKRNKKKNELNSEQKEKRTSRRQHDHRAAGCLELADNTYAECCEGAGASCTSDISSCSSGAPSVPPRCSFTGTACRTSRGRSSTCPSEEEGDAAAAEILTMSMKIDSTSVRIRIEKERQTKTHASKS